jgi:4'-phosphopantetheinyl transferase
MPALPQRTLLPVHSWEQARAAATAALRAAGAPVVISLRTPCTTLRAQARAQVRTALRELLGPLLGRTPEAVPLVTLPGQPPRLELPGLQLGLSLSHDSGMTLAALYPGGAVGVDVMRVAALPDWEALAHDYLGPDACKAIAAVPAKQRDHAFAQAWTRMEACMKCLGTGLREWTPELQRLLARCTVRQLALDEELSGVVAWIAGQPA